MGVEGYKIKGIKWLSWTNMSMSKIAGGLGFRDLHGFNLALLRKHCWNFINNRILWLQKFLSPAIIPTLVCLKQEGVGELASSGQACGKLRNVLKVGSNGCLVPGAI